MTAIPKAGSLVIDDGGRHEHTKKVGVGDCTTRAIAVTMREFNSRINYSVIKRDIISDKKKYYNNPAKRPEGCKSDSWLKTNDGAPRMTKRRLMRKYTGTPWVDVDVRKIVGTGAKFKDIAKALAPLDTVMLESGDHIVAVKNGVIYDSWDSTKCWVSRVFCMKSDVRNVRRLIK